jgi:hypothetical protein
MVDARKILSRVSGLGENEIDKIWEEVKANSKRIDECKGPHDFEKEGEGIGAKYRCKKCKGRINGVSYFWYTKGLEHGRANK